MRKKVIFITGAAGEIGHALIKALLKSDYHLLTLDLNSLPEEFSGQPQITHLQGDILDENLIHRLISDYQFDSMFHLAALLSRRSEFTPDMAQRVNVDGTMSLLRIAAEQSQWGKEPVKFIFPSSIAVYGMPDADTKRDYARVREWEWNQPRTMYGANKLYCEMMGTYYAQYFKQLAEEDPIKLDFRSVRFPGLISAFTVPSGGTTDYGPEMLHAAAQGNPYSCFVRPDSILPFMAMPDAVDALLNLWQADKASLTRLAYNVTSYSLSATEIRDLVLDAFPKMEVTFDVDERAQLIVDSWPAGLDDSAARRDWGWSPQYDVARSFSEYLIPNIVERYQED